MWYKLHLLHNLWLKDNLQDSTVWKTGETGVIYSDKLANQQVMFNCLYLHCTVIHREECMLPKLGTALDDTMSQSELTTKVIYYSLECNKFTRKMSFSEYPPMRITPPFWSSTMAAQHSFVGRDAPTFHSFVFRSRI